MSRPFWICLAITVISWAVTFLNGVLYVIHGESVSLAAFLPCSACSSFSTYNTLNIYHLDREMQERR